MRPITLQVGVPTQSISTTGRMYTQDGLGKDWYLIRKINKKRDDKDTWDLFVCAVLKHIVYVPSPSRSSYLVNINYLLWYIYNLVQCFSIYSSQWPEATEAMNLSAGLLLHQFSFCFFFINCPPVQCVGDLIYCSLGAIHVHVDFSNVI